MILAPEEAALFYRAWWPLLAWVNEKKRIVPSFHTPTAERPLPVDAAYQLRTALWADDRLREEFLEERGATVGADERALIASWKHRKQGEFVVYKHLRSHSIFMSQDVFAVLGLYSPLAEVVRTVPSFVEAVLLPFGDRIIIDGLVTSLGVQISFGPGMRRAFAEQYATARRESRIQTSLLPAAPPSRATAKPTVKRAKASRARSILGAWRITASERWSRDDLELVGPAAMEFGAAQLGALVFIAIQADIDYRIDPSGSRVEFSFEGDDEGNPCSGRGWATLGDDDTLRGRLYIHRGDDSAFTAERIEAARRPRRR